MKARLGFIGCGNMASAIIGGAVSSGFLSGGDITVYDVDSKKSEELAKAYGVNICSSVQEAVSCSRYAMLAVKPQVFPTVLPQIKGCAESNNTGIISIGAGKSLDYIGSFLNENTPIIRVMPNINAKAGAAMSAVCANKNVDSEFLKFANELCASFGEVIELPEEQFPLFAVIAGCSPAFSFMYIDSLARAGVKNGMSKKNALKIAAQAVLGSAKMILQDDAHPWELTDSVCSPGGTTIEGVVSLQKDAFESAVINAVEKSLEKDKSL